MQRSTLLFLLLGCTVAGVVGGLWFADSGALPPPPGGGGVERPGPDPGPEEPAPAPRPFGGDVPADAPQVTLQVTSLERFVAPPPARALAERADGEPLPARIVAGVGAGYDVERLGRGAALLAIEHDGGRLLRRLALDPQRPSVARVGGRVAVRGRVLDAAQVPLRGATVWFGERSADGAERSWTTDADGGFEADVPAGDGVPFVVRADGYASQWRAVTVDRGAAPLLVALQPGAAVYVQVAARALELERARVYVLPSAGTVAAGVSQWPFFAQLVGDGVPVDGAGKAVLQGLPQRGEVRLVVRHPLAAIAAPADVKLSDKPVQALVQLSFDQRVQQGLVVDEEGAGVVGAALFARAPGQRLDGPRSLRLLPPYLDLRGACVAASGPGGAFSIGLPAGDRVELAARAPGRAGRNVPWAAAMNAEIVLPAWRGGDAAVRVAPPVAGTPWRVATNLGGGVEVAVAPDEDCVLSLPHCGRFDLSLRVERDGEVLGERDVRSLMVTGEVALSSTR